MYHGHYSRPNRLTWILTANSPSLSGDLASRAVVVKIGSPKHAQPFIKQVDAFLADHREKLISDILTVLQADPISTIGDDLLDRWATWQDAILTRIGDGAGVAKRIQESRPEVDDDLDTAYEIARILDQIVRNQAKDFNPDICHMAIPNRFIFEAMKLEGIASKDQNTNTARLGHLCGVGPLSRLSKDQSRASGRCMVWKGESVRDGDKVYARVPPDPGNWRIAEPEDLPPT